MKLTVRQVAVLDAIRELTAKVGYPPTSRELAKEVGLSETRIRQHLETLKQRGVVLHAVSIARSIRLREDE